MVQSARVFLFLAAVCSALPAGVARADEPTEEARREAAQRYRRGLEFFDFGDFKLAQLEFQRAYELVPNYRVLYNLGLVSERLGSYAKATLAFERYLREGGSEVPAERRAEVERDLALLQSKTARFVADVAVPGAEVLVDEIPVGTTPLGAPLVLDVGDHRVALRKNGYEPQTRFVQLAGGESVRVVFELVPVKVTASSPIFITRTESAAPQRQNYAWIGWVATGVLAVGAGASGAAAVVANDALEREKDSPTATEESLDAAASRVRTWATVTDVLIVSAAVAGAASLYFTLKGPSKPKPSPKAWLRPGFSIDF
jgi:hypothetical protein